LAPVSDSILLVVDLCANVLRIRVVLVAVRRRRSPVVQRTVRHQQALATALLRALM
jgi:hypothetical protein